MKISNIVTLFAAVSHLANGENTISYEENLSGKESDHVFEFSPRVIRKLSSKKNDGKHPNEWKRLLNVEEIDMKEDIPSSCLNNIYDVELRAVKGVHFVLTAKSSDEKSSEDKCPKLLTFTSIDEKKSTHRVHDITNFDEASSSFLLGKASLKEIIDAEGSVEAIKGSKYKLTKNSCVHYAGHIWRKLQFDETNELASFLIENLLKNDGFLKVAANKISAGGLRVLAYATEKSMFEDFVKNTVYSQLNIKDGGEFMIEVTE